MDILDWKKKYEKKAAHYTHFDRRVSLKNCFPYITSANQVAHHGFYPFIHCSIKIRKVKDGKKAKPKTREIYYAAHLDGWIYRYYAYLINEAYNERVKNDQIDNVSVAYRTNLGKSNIDFAKAAFNAIRDAKSCYIMIGDFTSFFDNLDHVYLKERLCDLLSADRLPDNFYAVYKNITRFSYVELQDLLALRGFKNTRKGRKAFNSFDNERALSTEEFRRNKMLVHPNPNGRHGVPQGSPISAVLANVYMLEADKKMQEYVSSQNGFYMRYSDDFIVVLPASDIDFSTQYTSVKAILDSIPNLTLEDSKTKLFRCENETVTNCTPQFIPIQAGGSRQKNMIEFLGFSFDGKAVRLRDKTISKYYNRLYRKTRTIVSSGGFTPKKTRISCKNLYKKYSYKGSMGYLKRLAQRTGEPLPKGQNFGNFLDYVSRAQRAFDKEPINSPTKKHMQRIKKQLNKMKQKSDASI